MKLWLLVLMSIPGTGRPALVEMLRPAGLDKEHSAISVIDTVEAGGYSTSPKGRPSCPSLIRCPPLAIAAEELDK